MKAIYINDKHFGYTKLITDLQIKCIETRTRNVFKSLIGERVAIIRTGKGKPAVVGYCTLLSVKKYTSKEEFDKDFIYHLIDETDEYYCNGEKYGYFLADRKKCKPIYDFKKIKGNRSYCEIEF